MCFFGLFTGLFLCSKAYFIPTLDWMNRRVCTHFTGDSEARRLECVCVCVCVDFIGTDCFHTALSELKLGFWEHLTGPQGKTFTSVSVHKYLQSQPQTEQQIQRTMTCFWGSISPLIYGASSAFLRTWRSPLSHVTRPLTSGDGARPPRSWLITHRCFSRCFSSQRFRYLLRVTGSDLLLHGEVADASDLPTSCQSNEFLRSQSKHQGSHQTCLTHQRGSNFDPEIDTERRQGGAEAQRERTLRRIWFWVRDHGGTSGQTAHRLAAVLAARLPGRPRYSTPRPAAAATRIRR